MITINDLSSRLLDTEYAVRGALVQRALELEAAGKEIVYCNIGNPQALGQIPLTYIRQILSLIEYPELLNYPQVSTIFPKDIVSRAQQILKLHPYGTGAYSHSTGITFIREAVADFINKRDGNLIDKDHVFLTDGASKGVQSVIFSLIKNENDGLMVPIPQYPLYSATLQLYGGKQIDYYLDEDKGWDLNELALVESIETAIKNGIHPVGIAIINPGNPTGAVFSRETIEMVIRFAKKYNIAILADEVYQENVYSEKVSFVSFARVVNEIEERDVSLFSFHSVSKGYLGECGHRGGYVEFRNIPQDVLAVFEKLQSISLCSNITGQLVTYLMITPPQEGDESYVLYAQEKERILSSLHMRAKVLAQGLNRIKGVHVDIPQGAMYAFVKVELPQDSEVDLKKMSLDEQRNYHAKINVKYCMKLLEETGICVVPGSGFGQRLGTYHFRTTFLPPLDQIESFVQKFTKFHQNYVN